MPCTSLDIRDELLIAGSLTGNVGMWRCASHEPVAIWSDHRDKVTQLQFANDTTSYSTSHDGFFRARDLSHDFVVHSFSAGHSPLSSMAVVQSGVVCVGDWEGVVRQIDTRAKSCSLTLTPSNDNTSPIRALTAATAPPTAKQLKSGELGDGSVKPILFVAHGDGHVLAWDLRFPRVCCDKYHHHSEPVNDMIVTTDTLITCSDDSTIGIFNKGTGAHVDVLGGAQACLNKITLAGDHLLTGGFDGQIRMYSLNEVEQSAIRRKMEKEVREQLEKEEALRLKELAKKMKRKTTKKKKVEENKYIRRM